MYHKVSHKTAELFDLRNDGWVRGHDTGFAPLDALASLKTGYPLFVAGAPHSGKTELVLEMLLNCAVMRGEKSFIYLGENGEIEEIIAELCFKYIGKPYKSKSGYAMTESERTWAEMFIDQHFVFLDDSKDMTLTDFYKQVENAEREFGIKFTYTLFDPFNDAIDESMKHGGTHHWLNHELKNVRKISKKFNRIDILINHIADVPTSYEPNTKRAYIRPALPNEWNGGRTWWRRGFLMLLVYIPPVWLNDENGVPYGENVSLVYIQKAKPKGVGKVGQHARLIWDWKINRYCWYDAGTYTKLDYENPTKKVEQTEQSNTLKPNINFYERTENDEIPF